LFANEFAEVIIQFRMARNNGAFAIEMVHVFIMPCAVFNKTDRFHGGLRGTSPVHRQYFP
jgi:hypothetical protein